MTVTISSSDPSNNKGCCDRGEGEDDGAVFFSSLRENTHAKAKKRIVQISHRLRTSIVRRRPSLSSLHAGVVATLSLPSDEPEQPGASRSLIRPAMMGEGTSPRMWMQTDDMAMAKALFADGTHKRTEKLMPELQKKVNMQAKKMTTKYMYLLWTK